MMSAVKMRTPMDSASSRASRFTGTSNARMTANFLAPCAWSLAKKSDNRRSQRCNNDRRRLSALRRVDHQKKDLMTHHAPSSMTEAHCL